MKKILLVVSVAAMAISASCSKEELNSYAPSQEGFNVSIVGEMGEFAATKSTAESCIRLKWDAGDVVYAFGYNGSAIVALGSLIVEEGGYSAVMSGSLEAAPSDGKLYLVHCPLLTEAPAISEGSVSISLASQPSNYIPFVAYATVTGVSDEAQSELRASFKFASSVIKANVYGMANSTKMTLATLSDVNTVCKISFGETIAIVGETAGTVTKTLVSSSSASGKADFYIAVPAIDAYASRILAVKAGRAWYVKDGAVTKAHGYNAYVNTICDLTDLTISHPNAYVDAQGYYRGDGITITTKTTGVTKVWAPVNCGYDESHTYGLLYQWGRHNGSGYNDGSTYTETLIQNTVNTQLDADANEDAAIFYLSEYDWLATENDARWNAGTEYYPLKADYDPCPDGWRVPTYAELSALIGNELEIDGVGPFDNWFNGTKEPVSGEGLFLPAAGCRQGSDGSSILRGGYGNYWSSLVSGVQAWTLYFYYGYATMQPLTRAHGCSVRCVKN